MVPSCLVIWDAADILVLPTLSKGTPRVLIEARARGLPVVCSNVGGIPGSVTHEQDGLLVLPKDPVELARAISRIIEDDHLRRRLIQDAFQHAKRFTVERFIEELLASIREAIMHR